MNVDALRTLWFAVVLLACAGYAFVVRPLETSIAQRYAELEGAQLTLAQDLALERRTPLLEGERERLERQLRRSQLVAGRTLIVARFLATLARVAARDEVAVARVTATALPVDAVHRKPLLEEIPLEVSLQGRYGALIRTARDLNVADLAVRISLASLVAAERRHGASPLLEATFTVALLRLADATEPAHAPPV